MRIGEVASVHQNQVMTKQALVVAGKINDAAKEEGKAAMKLIDASGKVTKDAPKGPSGGTGIGQLVDRFA
jgi:hypothetical protein